MLKAVLRSALLLTTIVFLTSCTTRSNGGISPIATVFESPLVSVIPTIFVSPIPTQTALPSPAPAPTPQIISTESSLADICKRPNYYPVADCRKDQCLFASPCDPNDLVGIATVRGYYTKIKRTGFGDQSEMCDSFVITDGSQNLINSYLSLIAAGNGVNSKNELNQPIINLKLNEVSTSDKRRILSSTKNKSIELLLLSPIPPGMGAATCYSPVQIIQVNQ